MAFITLTTKGAYFCASGCHFEEQGLILRWLLSQPSAPPWGEETFDRIREATQVDPRAHLPRLQEEGIIRASEQPVSCPTGSLRGALPEYLSALSETGRVMLVDASGLCIGSAGIAPDRVETLSALAAKLMDALYHGGADLFRLLNIEYGVTCLYDVLKKNLFNFFPLILDTHRFILVSEGQVIFSGPGFRDVVWMLWVRYVATRSERSEPSQ